ncbi:MAG: YitT family protein [Clostridia bacterium]|nr:YitT family protein [Clostridia bacterium]
MLKKIIKEYLSVAIGAFLLAAGINMFLLPLQLSSGGIGTIGTVLLYIFKIPLSVTSLVLNAVLFIFGYRLLGRDAIIKTAAGILFLSLFLEISKYLPTFKEDMFFASVCGGVLVGIGIGIVVRVGGSTGGSDFAGIMMKRLVPHISVATFILIIDFVIIVISGFVFKSYAVTFYSALAMFISAKVADAILDMGDVAKSLFIITEKSDEVKAVVLEKYKRGVTEIYSKGAYSGEERMMLLCAVSPKEAPLVVKTVKSVDEKAFIIISDARKILGQGFKEE